ncbi:MAG: alpha-mannosidase [Clostridia bacterium]|nr:alpha-mannosidase [Clostridia bacterium]
MTYLQKLRTLEKYRGSCAYADRIVSELIYLDGVSKNENGAYDGRIEGAADELLSSAEKYGTLTAPECRRVEESLSDLSPAAKKYTELFISHAHIDMNWMWGYNETAAVTVDTFRTVLDLMNDYPDMTFGQSQASTYEIIDRFCPELIPDIKERIREGRWEVTAAEWVEPDKNMPDGESLTRQILQSRKYLGRLLKIDPDSLNIDFVPDTFGHNGNVPEILADAGIKYMYHCRGHVGPCVYRYVSPSGKSVLCYREYEWYNGEITPHKFALVPQFCADTGVDTYLCVFGVGDHGGGPSRRDIEHIIEYAKWPLTPTMRFGTFREFFALLDGAGIDFPVYDTERNYLFTGCYTTQSRIKMANRIAEARLNDAEALAACAHLLADAPVQPDRLDGAWRRVLFNHFHDILPGSGTVETREFAMGRFQEAMADINTFATLSMKRISEATDTSSIPFTDPGETTSEGGGDGFLQSQNTHYRFTASERGNGPVRAIQLFNPTALTRDEYTEVVIWDYSYGFADTALTAPDGSEVPFCVVNEGNGYWGHRYATLMLRAQLEPYGYTTYVLSKREAEGRADVRPHVYEYVDTHINDEPIVLENDLIRALFEKSCCRLISLVDKRTGEQLIDKPSCYFKYIEENPVYGMTSWREGPCMKATDLNAQNGVRYTGLGANGIYSLINYELSFGTSNLTCSVKLKKGSPVLEFETRIDYSEAAERGKKIPQIAFAVPVGYPVKGGFVRDIPYGTLRSNAAAHAVPALSYICADGEKDSIALMTDTKYSYKFDGREMSVTLIRSAYDPDPYPERGIHDIRIGVAVCTPQSAGDISLSFNRPIAFTSATKHGGTLPLRGSALSVEGDVRVTAVKPSEDAAGTAVRLCEQNGRDVKATVSLNRPVREAYLCRSDEKKLEPLTAHGRGVTVDVPAYSTVTLVIH